MRKSFLRKMFVAFAAVLLCANVMAQSFDLTKEFEGGQNFFVNLVNKSFTKDGNSRLVLVDGVEKEGYDQDNNWYSQYTVDKLTILDNNLNSEKEFTSGPLFDECTTVKVKSAVKTLKVEWVDTVYAGSDALNSFFGSFSVRIYDEETGRNVRYYYSDLVANFTEDEVRGYVNDWLEDATSYKDTTFLGERFLFESYYVQESNYYDWGTQYPKEGWIYKDYDDVCKVRISYSPDEYEEISRWNYSIYSSYYKEKVYCYDFIYDSEAAATITQTLFNDDDKYEFLLPVMEVFERSSYSSSSDVLITEYRPKAVGYKVFSEDGKMLHELIINAEKDEELYFDAYVSTLGNKNYLIVESYRDVAGEGYTDEVTRFYEIKKDGTGIQKVREMRGSMNIRPTVANRDEQITITLNDDNNSAARELIITGVNGQLVERRTIPAGENSVKVSAAMMRSGMYNFTLQKKGEIVDNGKVIVK